MKTEEIWENKRLLDLTKKKFKKKPLVPEYFQQHILKDRRNFYYERFLKVIKAIDAENETKSQMPLQETV
jgi:hypothetical protein